MREHSYGCGYGTVSIHQGKGSTLAGCLATKLDFYWEKERASYREKVGGRLILQEFHVGEFKRSAEAGGGGEFCTGLPYYSCKCQHPHGFI